MGCPQQAAKTLFPVPTREIREESDKCDCNERSVQDDRIEADGNEAVAACDTRSPVDMARRLANLIFSIFGFADLVSIHPAKDIKTT